MALVGQHLYLRNLVVGHLHLSGLWGVFLTEFFRRVATSLVGLFVPIYIWQETGTLVAVPLFFVFFGLSGLLWQYPAALIIRKIGVDKGMAIGSLFRAGFIGLLIFAADVEELFWLAAMCYGASSPFDWLTFRYVVAKVSRSDKHFGKAASFAGVMTQVASAISPVIGGLVIYKFGYPTLYLLAGSFLIVAIFMPFLDDFKKSGMHVSGKEIFERLSDSGIRRHVLSYGIKTFNILHYIIVWPIFLFSVVGSVQESGWLQTLSLTISLLVTVVTGRYVDKHNFSMMKPGALVTGVSWWLRMIARNTLGLFFVDVLYNIGNVTLWTPHEAMIYAKSGQRYTMEYLLVREVITFFTILINALFILASMWVLDDLRSMFIAVGAANLLAVSIPRLYRSYIQAMVK